MGGWDDQRPAELAAALDLAPDEAGGWSRRWRDDGGRIESALHLLGIGDCLDWHRVTGGAETWLHLAGGPLALSLSPNGFDASAMRLGRSLATGDRALCVIEDGDWRTAEPLGEWTLLSRMVAPADAGREAAPPGWRPVPRAGAL